MVVENLPPDHPPPKHRIYKGDPVSSGPAVAGVPVACTQDARQTVCAPSPNAQPELAPVAHVIMRKSGRPDLRCGEGYRIWAVVPASETPALPGPRQPQ